LAYAEFRAGLLNERVHSLFSSAPNAKPEPRSELMEIASVNSQLPGGCGPIAIVTLNRIDNRAPAKSIYSFS